MNNAFKCLFISLIFILSGRLAFSQKADFTGTWILSMEKSKLEDMAEGLTGSIFKIRQDGEKFKIRIYHLFGERKRKISFKMRADGKERRVKLIFKGRLEKKEDGLLATLVRKDFLNIVHYKFGSSDNEMIADEVFTGKPRDHHSIWVFERQLSK